MQPLAALHIKACLRASNFSLSIFPCTGIALTQSAIFWPSGHAGSQLSPQLYHLNMPSTIAKGWCARHLSWQFQARVKRNNIRKLLSAGERARQPSCRPKPAAAIHELFHSRKLAEAHPSKAWIPCPLCKTLSWCECLMLSSTAKIWAEKGHASDLLAGQLQQLLVALEFCHELGIANR